MELDELDRRIIGILIRDARTTVTDISKKLNVPRTTIMHRLERLEEEGYIRKYTAIPDYRKLGYNFVAYVLLRVKRERSVAGRSSQVVLAEKILSTANASNTLPYVEEAQIITGQYDILLKIRAKKWEDISRFLIVHLAEFEEIEHSETMLVLETVGEHISPNI
jgi:DNA-binding Lrp family transcriptional regulator